MPRIFVLTGPDTGLEVEVREGVLFGRGDDCAVKLKDASVSRQHARIEKSAEGFEIVDLGSRNGLASGGERVARILLKSGGEFTLGSVRMRFIETAAPAAVEEIELESGPAVPATTSGASTIITKKPEAQRPVEAGSARRRAIAQSGGVLQFEKQENEGGGTVFTDEFGQYSLVNRILMFVAVLAIAGGIFYAASKLSSKFTPEKKEPAPAEDTSEPK